jgi:hypothetical protein
MRDALTRRRARQKYLDIWCLLMVAIGFAMEMTRANRPNPNVGMRCFYAFNIQSDRTIGEAPSIIALTSID